MASVEALALTPPISPKMIFNDSHKPENVYYTSPFADAGKNLWANRSHAYRQHSGTEDVEVLVNGFGHDHQRSFRTHENDNLMSNHE